MYAPREIYLAPISELQAEDLIRVPSVEFDARIARNDDEKCPCCERAEKTRHGGYSGNLAARAGWTWRGEL